MKGFPGVRAGADGSQSDSSESPRTAAALRRSAVQESLAAVLDVRRPYGMDVPAKVSKGFPNKGSPVFSTAHVAAARIALIFNYQPQICVGCLSFLYNL